MFLFFHFFAKAGLQMFKNPFTPIFGGKPGVFFGRNEILRRFELAMVDQGSDDRALFFTGTRGCGKTALLEQISLKASAAKRRTIDLGPEDTISQLIHELAGFDETTSTISPSANVNVLGVGAGVSTGSVSKVKRIGRDSLQPLLLDACAKAKKGLLVTVDEVQKVPVEDISSLCNAFQMASRKGLDIMLAVAGLPYAHDTITKNEGCTYLRRASHEEIGLFTWDEAADAFTGMFSGIKGLKIRPDYVDLLNTTSYGHPYLMQLLGFHLMTLVNESNPGKTHDVSKKEIDDCISNALLAYDRRALQPLLDELPDNDKKYLSVMSDCLNRDRLASTADIAQKAGVPQSKLSRTRAHLIDHGIIASPERGMVMFCVPYLADYIKTSPHVSGAVEVARKRGV